MATEKQIELYQKLAKERNLPAASIMAREDLLSFSDKEMSENIERLLAMPRPKKQWQKQAAQPVQSVPDIVPERWGMCFKLVWDQWLTKQLNPFDDAKAFRKDVEDAYQLASLPQ